MPTKTERQITLNRVNASAIRISMQFGSLTFDEIFRHVREQNLNPTNVSGARYAAMIMQVSKGNRGAG
jgi:hypothetical protein